MFIIYGMLLETLHYLEDDWIIMIFTRSWLPADTAIRGWAGEQDIKGKTYLIKK